MTRDLRAYARQTNVQLLAGFIILLFLIGDGLIYVFYGRESAIMGVICLAAGVAPLLIIFLVLRGMEWIVERANRE